MKLSSKPATINANQKKVFEFLSDFNNFEGLMPEQAANWKSDADTCSFDIQGMASISLKYARKEPFHTIEVIPEVSPIKFNLLLKLEVNALDEQKTTGVVEIDADLNPMIAMVAKRPLENLVNVMGEKLNEVFS